MSYQKTEFKYPMHLDWRTLLGKTADELNELYKISNPREKRFITAWRNRNKSVVETPYQFRAKNINRASGSLYYALHGIKGLGQEMLRYTSSNKILPIGEQIAIRSAGIALAKVQDELQAAIDTLRTLQLRAIKDANNRKEYAKNAAANTPAK